MTWLLGGSSTPKGFEVLVFHRHELAFSQCGPETRSRALMLRGEPHVPVLNAES